VSFEGTLTLAALICCLLGVLASGTWGTALIVLAVVLAGATVVRGIATINPPELDETPRRKARRG
jgi:hypothetical protein